MSSSTRVFLTGRPHVSDEIVKCFGEAIRIPLSPIYGDIKNYLEMRLDGDTDPNAMDGELGGGYYSNHSGEDLGNVSKSIKNIPNTSLRYDSLTVVVLSFRLVSLNIDAILGEITLNRRRKKLDEMIKGEGLGGAYVATLL